jgi:hypothetical protein
MDPAVICERHRGRIIIPIILTVSDVPSTVSEDGPVIPFDFPVCLGVIGSREDLMDPQFAANGLEEICSNCGPLSVSKETGGP